MSISQLLTLIAIGIFAGFTGGALGLGGGVIIVPSLVFIMGLSQHTAQGTSLAVLIFPVALLGAYNYYRRLCECKICCNPCTGLSLAYYLGSLMSVNLSENIEENFWDSGFLYP